MKPTVLGASAAVAPTGRGMFLNSPTRRYLVLSADGSTREMQRKVGASNVSSASSLPSPSSCSGSGSGA